MIERAISVVHALSWIGGVLGVIFFALCYYLAVNYQGSMQKNLDALKGVTRKWPYGRWLLVAIISWSLVYITW
jgi:hypothetical protein